MNETAPEHAGPHTIGHVANMAGVTPQTIRAWEADGIIPAASRNALNQRRYSAADLDHIAKIAEARR